MSPWKKHKRKDGQTPARTPFVSIRRQAIAFNAQFVVQADLADMTRVSIFFDPSRFRIGFKFHSDSTDADSYALGRDGGGRGRGRSVQAAAVINKHSWIDAVAKIKDLRLRRFKPEWHSADSMWIVSLCPAFEVRVSHKSDIPSNVKGIYRYRRGDEIVYIGRGAIRSRLRAPERSDWDIEIIEYSPLQNEAEQERWESFWLDKFVQQHGKLPLYNRIGGKKRDS